MANSLSRNLNIGEHVVVDAQYIDDANQAIEARTFICEHGYGMHAFTASTGIIGKWADGSGDGAPARISGEWINAIDAENSGVEHE